MTQNKKSSTFLPLRFPTLYYWHLGSSTPFSQHPCNDLRAGVAYLAQTPWIRSGTVREAVLQELPYDEKLYWYHDPVERVVPDHRAIGWGHRLYNPAGDFVRFCTICTFIAWFWSISSRVLKENGFEKQRRYQVEKSENKKTRVKVSQTLSTLHHCKAKVLG